MRLLVTGGAGFIGAHVLRFLTSSYPDYTIVCADTLTYASNYDTGIYPLSEALGIDWGVDPILSEKDQNLPDYSDFKSPF